MRIFRNAGESPGFEAMIPTDQEIPYQQNATVRRISAPVLFAPAHTFADLARPVSPREPVWKCSRQARSRGSSDLTLSPRPSVATEIAARPFETIGAIRRQMLHAPSELDCRRYPIRQNRPIR